mmetsp:Transcript_9106/g.55434  ORF Transcript_9106/g.55434 Transcript_9106/m.55434 type:complete len:188 (+) Transcript_9106:496-1059(+)
MNDHFDKSRIGGSSVVTLTDDEIYIARAIQPIIDSEKKNIWGWIVIACVHQPVEASPSETHTGIRHPFHDLGSRFALLFMQKLNTSHYREKQIYFILRCYRSCLMFEHKRTTGCIRTSILSRVVQTRPLQGYLSRSNQEWMCMNPGMRYCEVCIMLIYSHKRPRACRAASLQTSCYIKAQAQHHLCM